MSSRRGNEADLTFSFPRESASSHRWYSFVETAPAPAPARGDSIAIAGAADFCQDFFDGWLEFLIRDPRQLVNPFRVKEFGQQRGVGSARDSWARRIDEHDSRAACCGAGQGGEREPEVIDRAEPVWAHDDGRGAQNGDQIAGIETFAERTEQATRAFDDDDGKLFLEGVDVRRDLGEGDSLPFLARREQGRERCAEVPRVDFVQ